MRKLSAMFALAAMLLGFVPAQADDHLVSRATAGTSLAGAAAERARNLASLDEALATPRARQAAAQAGLDIDRVRGSLSRLSNQELRDLSRRAAALQSDPAAGHYRGDYGHAAEALVVIALLGAIVLVVLDAADHR